MLCPTSSANRLQTRFAGLVVLGLLLSFSTSGPARASSEDEGRWCRVCHTQDRFTKESFASSAHGQFSCRTCHQGYQFNPHDPVEVFSAKPPQALSAHSDTAPAALAACTMCHIGVAEEPGLMAHGKHAGKAEGAEKAEGAAAEIVGPYCLDCHGDPHVIKKAGDDVSTNRSHMNERCMACHGDEQRMEGTGLSTHLVESYEHTMHARKLALGSDRAPGCADCHGNHQLKDMAQETLATCDGCHDDVNPSFAELGSHAPLTPEERPVGFYTQMFFGWLTGLTILGLVFHILLDLLAEIRVLIRRQS